MTPRPTLRSLPFDHGHRFYLHQKFRRSERRLNRRPRGFGVSEKFGISLVHRRKIADIRKVPRRFHDIGGGSAALLKDGRAYSHARRLRAHWGYQGTLLAFGDVQRDQASNMARCGVNAFYMRPDQDLAATLGAFERFSAFYQYA